MKRTVVLLSVITISILFAASLYAGSIRTPGVVKLDSLSDRYEPVRFDHAKHTAIASNCGTCHHQHGNNGALPCKECHSLEPSVFRNSVVNTFMPCKNCHGDFNPSNPGMPALKTAYHQQCFQCHRGIGNVGLDPKGCAEMCHSSKEMKVGMKGKK